MRNQILLLYLDQSHLLVTKLGLVMNFIAFKLFKLLYEKVQKKFRELKSIK